MECTDLVVGPMKSGYGLYWILKYCLSTYRPFFSTFWGFLLARCVAHASEDLFGATSWWNWIETKLNGKTTSDSTLIQLGLGLNWVNFSPHRWLRTLFWNTNKFGFISVGCSHTLKNSSTENTNILIFYFIQGSEQLL